MVAHKVLVREVLRFGVPATVYTTLCGRMSNQCEDGNNAEDEDSLVTCKLCKKKLAIIPTEGAIER